MTEGILMVGDRRVGPDEPPLIIAEIGSNHNGDMELARRTIDAAAAAGADVVKFQSWSERSLISEEEYERNTSYSDRKKHFGSLREMVRAYQVTPDQHHELSEYSRSVGVMFATSVFSEEEVDLVDGLDVPFFKIASMDIVHLPLLRYVARTGRPVFISTGMATLAEIDRAVRVIREEGNDDILLMHCVSIYPPQADLLNLRNIPMLSEAFDVAVGFSDHTLDLPVPLAAIALGATVVEKHFTLDREMAGWDHAISADPPVLEALVEQGRVVQRSLGSSARILSDQEREKARSFRRSIVTGRDIEEGEQLSEVDLAFKRPGTGIRPDEMEYVVGRRLKSTKQADEVLRWSDLS